MQPRLSLAHTSVPRHAPFTKYRMPARELQRQDSSCLTYLSPLPLAPTDTHTDHNPGAQVPHLHNKQPQETSPKYNCQKWGLHAYTLHTRSDCTRPFCSTSGCQVAPAWLLAQQHRLLRVIPAQQQERISCCAHACAHKALKQNTAAHALSSTDAPARSRFAVRSATVSNTS